MIRRAVSGPRIAAWVCALVGALAVGCALFSGVGDLQEVSCLDGCVDSGGSSSDGHAEGGDAAATADGSDAAQPGVPCAPDAAAGCFTLPPGWGVVALASSRSAVCPAGFGGQVDVVEGPIPASDACTCSGCQVASSPSCVDGAISDFYDLDGTLSCVANGPPLANSPGGSCSSFSIGLATDARFIPPPPTGGTCTAPGTRQPSKVAFAAQDRACLADSSASAGCVGTLCNPVIAAPFQKCIARLGDHPCTAPLAAKHLVGTDVTFDCGACGCSVTATCSGTITFYRGGACAAGATAIPVDGLCHATGGGGVNYSSYQYVANAPSAACAVTGAASALTNLALVGETTICCPN